jgi:hypothetical protein
MLPDCVAYLRPKQLIKLSSNLFVYFFECDYYYHQVPTSTHPLYLHYIKDQQDATLAVLFY